jgi:hypothetical protein
MASDQTVANLAVEYWKLLRLTGRSLEFVPEVQKHGMAAQFRFFHERLHNILAAENMECVSFEGRVFEVNMPAVAVNAEDLAADQEHIVERTLEPAVILAGQMLVSGKVFLRSAKGEDK